MIRYVLLWAVLMLLQTAPVLAQVKPMQAKPVVVITDLYHPHQDPGDNLDLIMGYALPQVDLKAVIIDVTDHFRKDTADHPDLWKDPNGPREAGLIPILQLNYIFNRAVPYGIGPGRLMRSETDQMADLLPHENRGVTLLLRILEEAQQPVDILSFGSARVLAVAYNRAPQLMKSKIGKIHISAGTASQGFKLGKDENSNKIPGGEWNVALDPFAFKRMMRSDLPIVLYPCASRDGAFAKDVNNSYWQLPDISFVQQMDKRLQRYIGYAFNRVLHHQFIRLMDADSELTSVNSNSIKPFHFWETAIWMNVANLKLVTHENDTASIIPASMVKSGEHIIEEGIKPCKITIRDDGRFDYRYLPTAGHNFIFYRSNPDAYEKAMQTAVPKWYASFAVNN